MRRVPLAPLAAALALLASAPLAAALVDAPHVDIRFISEHLGEAAQDARSFTLPWPGPAPAAGRWQPFAAVGWTSAGTEFLEESGRLASAGAVRGFPNGRALVLFGFYDQLSVGGGAGEQVLSAGFLASSPLDLPERARFSNPRGEIRHFGVGAAWSWRLSPATARRPWRAEAGLLVDRLTLDGFRIDYLLLGGADAGARGTLDQSSEAIYATPFAGVGWSLPIGTRLELRPRFLAGAPVPEGDLDGRLIGPGYDRSSRDPGGRPAQIGDGFATLNLGLLHRASGLELDLGGALAFPLFQRWTHDRVDRAVLVHVTWRGR